LLDRVCYDLKVSGVSLFNLTLDRCHVAPRIVSPSRHTNLTFAR